MNKSDSETLVKVTNLSKKFCRDLKKSLWYGLKEMGNDIFHPFHEHKKPNLRPSEFWANKDISFEVKRGECLGLIGRNGAGKTTLLKMLNGIIKPDRGSIEIKGKVGALIALGAGFNPILTGRENIYVNGAILGLNKREIELKIGNIIDFAEIKDAIDSPVRTYSSGMRVRLGFAIASILITPDVLILDEVLAVGDINFTIKCLNSVRKLCQNSAVILVSHNIQIVSQFCTSLILLDNGKVLTHTKNVNQGIERYISIAKTPVHLSGTNEVQCSNETLLVEGKSFLNSKGIKRNQEISIITDLIIDNEISTSEIRIAIMDTANVALAVYTAIDSNGHKFRPTVGKHKCRFEIGSPPLSPGKYNFLVVVKASNPNRICLRKSGILEFNMLGNENDQFISAPFSFEANVMIVNS